MILHELGIPYKLELKTGQYKCIWANLLGNEVQCQQSHYLAWKDQSLVSPENIIFILRKAADTTIHPIHTVCSQGENILEV
jgi:hypothetical protein